MGSPNDYAQSDDYLGVRWTNTYALDPGVCVLPLAEDPPTDPTELADWSPVVVLRLHAPYRIRKATYVADKQSNPPVIPGMNDTGAFVLVAGDTAICNTLNTTGRNYDWTAVVNTMYVENCVSRPQDGFVLGSQPFDLVTTDANKQTYGTKPPCIGAIAHAGQGAVAGYRQGQAVLVSQSGSGLKAVWGYNTAEFFPGTLVSTDMANGGTDYSTTPGVVCG